MCSLNITITSSMTIKWLYNGNPAMTTSPNKVTTTDNTATLLIGDLHPSDAGHYECLFSELGLQRVIVLGEFYVILLKNLKYN